MDTAGRAALVTGASRGLGYEIARLLAREGYAVTIVGREAESLERAVRAFDGAGHVGWTLDLSQRSQTHELLQRMEAQPFDLVVNNAGATRFGPLSELSADLVEGILWLNLVTPALICRQFVRCAPRGGMLVNVTSIVATVPMPGNTLYSAAKAGLRALSEGLWFEARERDLRVIEFRPVSLDTEFHRHAGSPSVASERMVTDPADAAQDLVRVLRRQHVFSHGAGLPGWVIDVMNRMLPRRVMVTWLGRRAARSGYLTGPVEPPFRAGVDLPP